MMCLRIALLAVAVGLANPGLAQTVGTLDDWFAEAEDRRQQAQAEREKADAATTGRMSQAVSLANTGVGAVVAFQEMAKDWRALDGLDASCDAAFSGGPTVPSSCAGSDACRSCYAEATRSIDFNRRYIERARCITAANLKMAKSATAFGDSASGVHGMAGLSWQLQGKPQIKKATDKLKKTYVEKAAQYLSALERALQKLGQCEAEHFNEPDWYQRYGWTYMTFMRSKYESAPIPD